MNEVDKFTSAFEQRKAGPHQKDRIKADSRIGKNTRPGCFKRPPQLLLFLLVVSSFQIFSSSANGEN